MKQLVVILAASAIIVHAIFYLVWAFIAMDVWWATHDTPEAFVARFLYLVTSFLAIFGVAAAYATLTAEEAQ